MWAAYSDQDGDRISHQTQPSHSGLVANIGGKDWWINLLGLTTAGFVVR